MLTLFTQSMVSRVVTVRLRDYVTNTILGNGPSGFSANTLSLEPSSGTFYPLVQYINCENFSLNYRNFIAAVSSGHERHSFKEALKDPHWRKSMQNDIQALENNGTWTMEDLTLGNRGLGIQWVYRIKYNSDGSIKHLKFRLVEFGNHQKEGLDYTGTFAPVAKMITIQAFLAIIASKNWELH